MSAITLDRNTSLKLRDIHESTHLVDEAGNVLGIFTPQDENQVEDKIPQHLMDFLSSAEFDKRCKSTHPGSPLKEVWERIHAQAKLAEEQHG